jgi:hypothetical protein
MIDGLSALGRAAIDLAGRGWAVFPVHGIVNGRCTCGKDCGRNAGKHPLLNGSFYEASTDPQKISGWWGRYPSANIGARMGDGRVVIDIDGPEGEATLAQLEKQYGPLPVTLTSKTGTGHHRFFTSNRTEIPGNVGKLGEHVDIRGVGTYVVLPPSRHRVGNQYAWEDPSPWAQLPVRWLAALASAPRLPRNQPDAEGKVGPGKRNDHLASLAGSMRHRGMSAQAIAAALLEENRLRCDPPLAEKEVRTIAQSVGRYAPDVAAAGERKAEASEAPPSRAVTRCFVDIEAKPLRWLWPRRLLFGKINFFSGDPGEGKSLVALDIAARCSCGKPFPDGPEAPRCSTLILSAEDDAADTLKPRLETAGAIMSRIHVIDAVRRFTKDGKSIEGSFSLATDLDAAEDALVATRARLLIIDPISAYLGSADAHTNAEVRGLLHPLAALAAKYDVALLCITHFRKSGGTAIAKSIDSIAFLAAARSSWAFGRDPDNQERRMFLPSKCNLARAGGGLAYNIESGIVENGALDGTPYINWGEVVTDVTADRMLSAADDHRLLPAAQRWLGKFLADGPKPQEEVETKGKQKGFSWRTIRRAADELRVDKKRKGFGKDGVSMWSLSPYLAKPTHSDLYNYDSAHENKGDSTEKSQVSPIPLDNYGAAHENKGDNTESDPILVQRGHVRGVGQVCSPDEEWQSDIEVGEDGPVVEEEF